MSFDLAVFYSSRALSKEEAKRRCLDSSEVEEGAPMIAFQKDLAIVYPDLEAIPEDKLEDSPWSFSPDRSGGHTFLCIRWSAVDAAVPIIFEIALKHNLVVYDPQDDEVYVSNELFDASPQP